MISQLNLNALTRVHRDEYLAAIARVLDSSAFIGGDELRQFETEFAHWASPGTFAVGCGNGTDAITLAAMALDLPPGSEAILPAMTFFGSAEGLLNAGYTIKLADVKPGTWLLDPDTLEAAITEKTKLIVPVHLYGQMAPMDRIREIADRYGCKILEDASQAHGSRWLDKPVGHYGDIATYSLYPGKNLGAFGDGGVILSRYPDLIERCRALGNHGGLAKYEHHHQGFNSRLDGLQAAILNIKLKYVDGWNEKRRAIAKFYQEALMGLPGLTLPKESVEAFSVYHQFVVLVERRKSFMAHMEKAGIQTSVHYPLALHQLPALQALNLGTFPVAARLASEGVSLPMCPTLEADDLIHISETMRAYFR